MTKVSGITRWTVLVWFALSAPGALAGDEAESQLHWQAALEAFRKDRTPDRALALVRIEAAAGLQQALAAPATQALTAWALARQPVPAARESLERLIASSDQVTGYWAAKALGALADPRSIPVLAARLPGKPRNYWELARRTPAGLRPVFHRIRQGRDETIFAEPGVPNLRVARAAMEALGAFSDQQSLAVLERALGSEQHLVRYGAVLGLRRRGDEKARALVRRAAASDPVFYVRRAAERSLRAARGTPAASAQPALARLRHVPAIAFIKTANRSESNLGFRDSYFFPKTPWYAWGEDLYTLTPPAPDGKLRNLTRLAEGGRVQGPEVSADGQRLLVGMRRHAGEPFHIFEIQVDSGQVRQLTHGGANDVDPCYLPGGRIAFSSDRDGTLEYYHQERTRTLYVMDAAGGEPRQITFNPNQDYEPVPLRNGSILYASYRFYGQDGSGGVFSRRAGSIARIETQLRTTRIDGGHDRHLYGSRRGGFYVPVRELPDGDQFQAPSLLRNRDHLGVSVSQARELADGRLVCITPAGLTVLDPRLDPRDCELPVFPEVVNLAGGEEVYIHNHDDMNPIGRYTSPYPVDRRGVLVAHAPWYRQEKNAYGIYLLDLDTGAKTLVYDDPGLSDVDPIPLGVPAADPEVGDPHSLPARAGRLGPSGGGDAATNDRRAAERASVKHAPGGTGTLVIQSVFESDIGFDRAQVRYLRVLAAERIGVSMNANGGFRSRVLATVPVEKDGSVYLEVPADTPLHFNLLDRNESILVHETAFTTVRPGEQRTCIGCHQRQTVAPPNRPLRALARPPYRAGETAGDLIYMGRERRTYSVIHW